MIDAGFVRRWDEALISDIESEIPDNVPPHVAEHRSVLREPASEAAIADAERRLGAHLPPSYKQFLRQTNGAFANAIGVVMGAGWDPHGDLLRQGIGYLPADELTANAPIMAREWASNDLEGLVDRNYRTRDSEWAYLNHDRTQDPVFIKTGHYRHGLIITTNDDGWEVLLNPLVRQPDGEWEAWDFGTKYPGAYRYRSFEALLQHQIDSPPDFTATTPTVDVEWALQTLDRHDASPEERQDAIHQLWLYGLGADEHPRWREEALKLALDRSADRYIRGNQARTLCWKLDFDGLRLLLAESEPLVWHPAVGPLVVSSDPEAREVILEVLTTRPVDHMTVMRAGRDPTGVLWDAYRETGNLFLLAASARGGNLEAQRTTLQTLADDDVDDAGRSDLEIALSYFGAELIDDVVTAAQGDKAPVPDLGRLLARIAPDRAVPVLRQVFYRPDLQPWTADAAFHLAQIGSPEAMATLVQALETDIPHPAGVIDAMGDFPHPEAVAAVASWASDARLLLDVVYALEHQGIEEARVELARLDHIQAWRALGRLRDKRALEPLLEASRSQDPDLRREALEGLRDLSDPASADRLLEIAQTSDPDSDEAAICAHALVVMRVPQTKDLLNDLVDESENPHVGRVVADWLGRLDFKDVERDDPGGPGACPGPAPEH